MRFIHAADIHLGYEQYNLLARADDFARAYIGMVEYACDVRADFVLLAGDLFHRSSADAWMLKQATSGLQILHDACIPVIAVEGNHDAQHARKHMSWMEFLCDQELLTLLNVEIAENKHKAMLPFDPIDRRGSYIDVAGARIYGLKYYGAVLAKYLDEVRGDIEAGPDGYTILMLHAGMQGQVPHMHGGLTYAELDPFRGVVDYVALGHVHKRLQEDWIFNPGSTERNSMEELDWPHGFFDVEVDVSLPGKHRVTPVETPGLRPFHRIRVHADDGETLEMFTQKVGAKIAAERGVPPQAVVEIELGGVAGFKRQEVPLEQLKGEAEIRFDPLVVRVRNNLVPPGLVQIRGGERMKRSELERAVIDGLVYQDPDYRDRAAAWTNLILNVKNMAAGKETAPAIIAEHVQSALSDMSTDSVEEPNGEPAVPSENDSIPLPVMSIEEPMGGEQPCMANLFEEY